VLTDELQPAPSFAAVQLTLEVGADGPAAFDLVFLSRPQAASAGARLAALSGG
jgi:hypothetical protein